MSITREEMIARVSAESEEDDTRAVEFYLDNAAEVILNRLYPFDESTEGIERTVPSKYLSLQMRIAIGFLAKRGAEFEGTHVENGIHRHYSSADVPADMLREITPKAVVF